MTLAVLFLFLIPLVVATLALTVYGTLFTYRTAVQYFASHSQDQARPIAAIAAAVVLFIGVSPLIGVIALILKLGNRKSPPLPPS